MSVTSGISSSPSASGSRYGSFNESAPSLALSFMSRVNEVPLRDEDPFLVEGAKLVGFWESINT